MKVEVKFEVESWGHSGNGWDDPGEGPWVNESAFFADSGMPTELTNKEFDSLIEHVCELSLDVGYEDYE